MHFSANEATVLIMPIESVTNTTLLTIIDDIDDIDVVNNAL